jgi:hypothetical protein
LQNLEKEIEAKPDDPELLLKRLTWCIQQPELTEGTTGGGLGCVSREPVRHLTGNRTTRSSESLYQWLFIKDCPVIRRRD